VHTLLVTIPDMGRCLGSGKPPREGTEETAADGTTGVCVACSGRVPLEDGTIVAHEAAGDDDREASRSSGSAESGEYEGPDPEQVERGAGTDEDQGV
jgi:hypothetical protein